MHQFPLTNQTLVQQQHHHPSVKSAPPCAAVVFALQDAGQRRADHVAPEVCGDPAVGQVKEAEEGFRPAGGAARQI